MRVVRSRAEARPDLLPSHREIEDACRQARARNPAIGLSRVALVRVPELDTRSGARIWCAVESLQVTGSFKVRGAACALARAFAAGTRAVVAASAGNHGAGVAYAARHL